MALNFLMVFCFKQNGGHFVQNYWKSNQNGYRFAWISNGLVLERLGQQLQLLLWPTISKPNHGKSELQNVQGQDSSSLTGTFPIKNSTSRANCDSRAWWILALHSNVFSIPLLGVQASTVPGCGSLLYFLLTLCLHPHCLEFVHQVCLCLSSGHLSLVEEQLAGKQLEVKQLCSFCNVERTCLSKIIKNKNSNLRIRLSHR